MKGAGFRSLFDTVFFARGGYLNLKHVDLYTDGACSGNPGPGGYGAILVYKEIERELAGRCADTTNNRMELTAVIAGLEALREPCEVTLYTDSKYVADGIEKGWAVGWRKRGWKKADGKDALNPELWDKLLKLIELHNVKIVWIKGHDGHPYNERCDRLATGKDSATYL